MSRFQGRRGPIAMRSDYLLTYYTSEPPLTCKYLATNTSSSYYYYISIDTSRGISISISIST